MATDPVRVAVIEPAQPRPALAFPEASGMEVVLRASLGTQAVDQLQALGVRVVVLDLRGTCTTEIGAAMRLVRAAAPGVRVVAVTDPGDVASAQFSIASGAVAHLGSDVSPLTLLRAVNAASRNKPSLGGTGERAARRLRRDYEA